MWVFHCSNDLTCIDLCYSLLRARLSPLATQPLADLRSPPAGGLLLELHDELLDLREEPAGVSVGNKLSPMNQEGQRTIRAAPDLGK